MGWERRRGRSYYTRSRKVDGRVVREYVGGGLLGELAAREDAARRAEHAAKDADQKADWARYEDCAAKIVELDRFVEALTEGSLLAAGYHQHHRGDWRRKRG